MLNTINTFVDNWFTSIIRKKAQNGSFVEHIICLQEAGNAEVYFLTIIFNCITPIVVEDKFYAC